MHSAVNLQILTLCYNKILIFMHSAVNPELILGASGLMVLLTVLLLRVN